MHINPYGSDAAVLACALRNRPPSSPAELDAVCAEHGLNLEEKTTGRDLEQVLGFLDDWAAVPDPGTDEATCIGRVNELLAAWAGPPQLTDHAGDGWHLHYRPAPASTARIVCTMLSVGTALFLIERGTDAIATCAAEGCQTVFADRSRNRTQRYCSPACANREAVRRHRRRAR